jgi:PD-(D/E)XK endonuclease
MREVVIWGGNAAHCAARRAPTDTPVTILCDCRSSSAGQSTALVKRGPRVRIPSPALLRPRSPDRVVRPDNTLPLRVVEHPKTIGDCTTLAVMLALRASGYDISVPFGENTRYDLVLDDGESLRRVQCKTGRLREGAVRFATASSYYHHPNEKPTQRHYRGQVDGFAVHCRETGAVYLVPIENLPSEGASLRVTPPLNRQRKRIRFAADYEIARVPYGVVPDDSTGCAHDICVVQNA